MTLLRDEGSVVQTSDGQVVLNLFPLLDRVFDRINALDIEIAGNTIEAPTLTDPADPDASRAELSAAIGRELKPTFGVIPVADSAKLEAAQRYVTLFDALVVILFVVTALLAVLTVVLARRRIRMVALLGLGGLAALLVARLVINSAADGLATAVVTAGPGAIIGGQVVQEIADSYREFARGVLLLGLVAAVAATAATWLLERRAGAESTAAGIARLVDGWFLALAGLTHRPGHPARGRAHDGDSADRRGRLRRLAGRRRLVATRGRGGRRDGVGDGRLAGQPSSVGRVISSGFTQASNSSAVR